MSEYQVKPNDTAAMLAVAGLSAMYGDKKIIGEKTYQYCYSALARTLGDVVQIGIAGVSGAKNPAVTVPATTAVGVRTGVIANTTTAAGGVWAQIEGIAYTQVEGTTDIADGDALQGVNGQVYGVKDGGATATADTFGIAMAGFTTNSTGFINVWLKPYKYVTIG